MTTTTPLPACRMANSRAAAVRSLAPDGLELVEVLDDPPHLRPAADAVHALVEPGAEGVEQDPVVVHQPDERQGRRDLLAVAQLGRRAEVHRQAGVEQGVDVQVFLFEEQLQEELVEPAVDVPVDVPQVVADGVVAMLGELDRRPPPLALPLALHPADEDLAADQLELLELVQELRVEQRAGRIAARGRGGAGRSRARSWRSGCGHGGSSVERSASATARRSRSADVIGDPEQRRASALTATPRPTSQGTSAARKIIQRALSRSGRAAVQKAQRREPAFEDHQRARPGVRSGPASARSARPGPSQRTAAAQSPTRQTRSPVVKIKRLGLGRVPVHRAAGGGS